MTMTNASCTWLPQFAETAKDSDRFKGRNDHVLLLAAGLMGEAGSVLAELKKEQREREAYPAYRRRMHEELGDFLWYYVRLCDLAAPGLVNELPFSTDRVSSGAAQLPLFLQFAGSVGEIMSAVEHGAESNA